jgi:hypothetical protein
MLESVIVVGTHRRLVDMMEMRKREGCHTLMETFQPQSTTEPSVCQYSTQLSAGISNVGLPPSPGQL